MKDTMIPKHSNIILQKIYYTVLSKKSELMSRKIQLLIQWILTKHLPCLKYHSGLIGIQHWTKGHDSRLLTVYIPVWMYTKTRIFSIHRILLPKNERNNWHVTTHSFNTGKNCHALFCTITWKVTLFRTHITGESTSLLYYHFLYPIPTNN